MRSLGSSTKSRSSRWAQPRGSTPGGSTSDFAYLAGAAEGEVIFEEEGQKLCLINTKIMMIRDGQIIFSGTDEQLTKTDDPYIKRFLRGK